MKTTSIPQHSLVLSLVTTIGQALEEGAYQTARSLSEALGAALVETGRVTETRGINTYRPFVSAKADWNKSEELVWIVWESAHRHLRSQKEGTNGCRTGCRSTG